MYVDNYMDNGGMGGQQNGALSKHCPICTHAVQPGQQQQQCANITHVHRNAPWTKVISTGTSHAPLHATAHANMPQN